MKDNLQSPQVELTEDITRKWQSFVDILAEVLAIPSALIMRLVESDIEVFVSSQSDENPYHSGDREHFLGSGLYCETVINANDKLLIPNARADEKWENNPDIKLNMSSYLGFPIIWPGGKPFGTICVLDNKENSYSETYEQLIMNFRDIIQDHLELIYMNTMISQTSDLMAIVDRDYINRAVNPAYLHAFAKTNEEIIGHSVSDVLGHKQFEKVSKPNLDRAFAGEELTSQAWIDVPGLGRRFVDLSYSPVRDTDGMISCCVVTIHNSTELKLTEEELRLANETIQEKNDQLQYEVDVKNRFFSIIAHDLRSPFVSLLGLTELMAEKGNSFSKEKNTVFAKTVNEVGKQIYGLLHNLLEWSSLQIKGAKFESETFSLRRVTQESIDILKPMAVEKNIVLTNKIEEFVVFTEQNMVQTVIRNLIANALKFTPSGGSVEVSSCEHRNMLGVTVTDTGVGMSKEHAQQVFAIDQKTSTRGTAGETGTGLGLPLCKDMIERNGGQIWFESTPGQGARFHFTLPTEPGEK